MRPYRLVLTVSLVCASVSSAQDSASLRLVPRPRELSYVRAVPVPAGVTIDVGASADDKFAAADLSDFLKSRGVNVVTARPAPARAIRIALVRANGPSAKAYFRKTKTEWNDSLGAEGYLIAPDSGAQPGMRVK